jgi:hypothetical protein
MACSSNFLDIDWNELVVIKGDVRYGISGEKRMLSLGSQETTSMSSMGSRSNTRIGLVFLAEVLIEERKIPGRTIKK